MNVDELFERLDYSNYLRKKDKCGAALEYDIDTYIKHLLYRRDDEETRLLVRLAISEDYKCMGKLQMAYDIEKNIVLSAQNEFGDESEEALKYMGIWLETIILLREYNSAYYLASSLYSIKKSLYGENHDSTKCSFRKLKECKELLESSENKD